MTAEISEILPAGSWNSEVLTPICRIGRPEEPDPRNGSWREVPKTFHCDLRDLVHLFLAGTGRSPQDCWASGSSPPASPVECKAGQTRCPIGPRSQCGTVPGSVRRS